MRFAVSPHQSYNQLESDLSFSLSENLSSDISFDPRHLRLRPVFISEIVWWVIYWKKSSLWFSGPPRQTVRNSYCLKSFRITFFSARNGLVLAKWSWFITCWLFLEVQKLLRKLVVTVTFWDIMWLSILSKCFTCVTVSESVAGRLTPLPVSTEQRITMKNSNAREVYGILNEKTV